jgi:hypothetical protein
MKRTNSLIRRISAGCMAVVMAASMMSFGAFAEETAVPESVGIEVSDDGYVYLHKEKIAKKTGDNRYEMIMQADAHANGAALDYLVNNNEKKTVELPKGTLKTDRTILLGNNTTIIATGTTVFQTNPQKTLIIHEPARTDYKSLYDVKIKGGTWKIKDNEKQLRQTSTFRFNFASNITLEGCTILTNFKSHAVELIACKNVTVNKCKLIAKGKTISSSLEEALQIDLSTAATAPSVVPYGDKFLKGQTCSNITVKNSTISGGRGVCANKTDTENSKYLGKYHKNITITGCKITGITSEAVALHNSVGLKVKNNTIISKGSRTDTVYTIGLNIALFKSNKISAKYKNVITGNTIKGGRQALFMKSYSGNKYGVTTIKNNKLYCKKGKSEAMAVSDCKKLVNKGNKKYNW